MRSKKFKSGFTIAGAFFMMAFCLTPFIYMLVISFGENPEILSDSSSYEFTFENYLSILTIQSLHFIDYLRNSLIISAISAILSVFIASLSAYAITHLPLPGKVYILLFVLAISMFPQISLIGYLFKFMAELDWINTYYSLVFPYIAWSLPLSLWILTSYFAKIPKDLNEAALIDGCSRWQALYKVILPVASPGLFSTLLLAFIFGFNEFMFALMFTIDHKARTVPVGIALFQGLHGETPWGSIMAASALATIPIVILTIIFQKHIIQGLTRGAVKG
jgi:multiple sugar transport system permease protein